MKKIIFILLVGVLITSCKKEATVWESDWSAPIVNDTLTLANWVNDSTIVESPSNFYELDLTRTLFHFDVNEVVSIPDTTIHEVFTNGPVFDNVDINPGSSMLFGQQIEEHEMVLDDIQLKKVIIKSGVIEMRIENPLGTMALFDLELPGYKKDGAVLDVVYEIPAGSVASPGIFTKTIDLSGYEIDLTGQSGTDYNKFMSIIDVIADPNGSVVNFGNEHLVNVDAAFKDIKIDYARGYFGSRMISDTTEFDLDELNIYESGLVDLSALSLSFEVINGIKVGAQGTLHNVSNVNAMGTSVALTGGAIGNAFNLDPATGTWNTLTASSNTLTFTSGNSNIEAYLENLGIKHTLGYSFTLNPWGNTSGSWDEIYPHSDFKVKLHAQMPLAIGLDNLVLKDTFDISLNQDPAKTRIISGELILNTSNAFPFSADVSMMLLDASGNVLHTVYGSEKIEASQFGDYNSTYDFNVANSTVHFVLTDDMISDVNEVKQVIVRSSFNSINPATSNSEQMIIPIDAFLGVKLKTKFKSENRF